MLESKKKTSVVIAAAGSGSRMGMNKNKQFLDIAGKPVLARTIQAFENCKLVDEIIIIAAEPEVEYCNKNIVEKYRLRKVKSVICGGEFRQQSVYNGLMQVSSDCDIVLIHDGARPFIDCKSICECIKAAEEAGAACIAVPVKDTIKRVDDEGFVEGTLDRRCLWAMQTPQAFQYNLIIEAHRNAMIEGYVGTDDAVLVERIGHRVKLVTGSYYNIKITTKEDLAIAEGISTVMG